MRFENPINRWIFQISLITCMIAILFALFYSLIRGNLLLGFIIAILTSLFIFFLGCWYREFWLRPITLELHEGYFISNYRYGRKSRRIDLHQISRIVKYGSAEDPDNDVFLEFIDGKWYRIKKPIAYAFEEKYGLRINHLESPRTKSRKI